VVGHEVGIGSTLLDLTVGNRINIVDLGKEVKGVGDKDLGSARDVVYENLLEYRLSDVGI